MSNHGTVNRLAGVLIVAGLAWWLVPGDTAGDLAAAPPSQKAFCAVIAQHRTAYREAQDGPVAGRDEKLMALWRAREAAVVQALAPAVRTPASRQDVRAALPATVTARGLVGVPDPSAVVADWIGRVAGVRRGFAVMGEGVAVDVALPCGATLTQFGFAPPGAVAALTPGDRVAVAGAFLEPWPGFDDGAAFLQRGLTVGGRLVAPAYKFHVADIRKQ